MVPPAALRNRLTHARTAWQGCDGHRAGAASLSRPLTPRRSWRNAASRKIWEGEKPNQFRGLDVETAVDLPLALNVAKSLRDLSPLKSVGLHKLKGERRNQWAMTVNARWRICFAFRKGDAFDVEIVDYHKG